MSEASVFITDEDRENWKVVWNSMNQAEQYALRTIIDQGKQLRARDEQMATLATEWEGLLTQLLPSGEEAIACLPSGALWSFDAVIKEV